MSQTVRLDQPPARVFDVLTDPAELAVWHHAFDRAERLDDGPLRVGSRLRAEARVDGRPAEVDVEVVAFDPPERLQLEARSDEVHSLTTLRVRPVDGGSEVTATAGAVGDQDLDRQVDPAANPTFADLGHRLLEGLTAAFADEPTGPR